MPDPVGDGQPAAGRELPELAPGLLRLSKVSVFAGLPPRDVVVLDRLLGARRWQCGPPPTELMRPGHLYVVREGRLALFERSRSGHLVMLALLQAGAVYSSLGDAPCPYVDALVPSAVSPIPATLLERLIARYPRLGSNVAGALSERIAMLREVACVLAEPRVEDRLRARLLEIAERMGTTSIAGVRIPIRLTHAQWALLVGGSRESVTLAFGQLRARGEIVMDGRAITLTWSGMGERRDRPHADAAPPARAGHAGLA
jgi:CRP-like cAMP-binding protein